MAKPNYIPGVGGLALSRYDAQAHFDGTAFRHNSNQIDVNPAVNIDGYLYYTVSDALGAIGVALNQENDFIASGDLSGTNTNQTVIRLQGGITLSGTPSSGQVLTATSATAAHWATPALGFTANGDLSGTSTSQTVVGFRGRSISIAAPSPGQFYVWNGSQWAPQNAPSGSFSAGGDLTGTPTNQTVVAIQGISVASVAISNGYVLTATGTANAEFQPFPVTISGDLGGTLASQTVEKLQGTALSNTPPTTNQYLQYNGTEWVPYTLTLGGDVTGSPTSNTVSNLQGHTLLITSPSNGDVLTYNTAFARWDNAPAAGGFTAGGDLSGTSTNQTVLSAQNDAIVFSASAGISFESSMGSPNVTQVDLTTASGIGHALTIQAQNETGTTSTGGALVLTSGTGTSTNGQVLVQVGGVTAIDLSTTTTSISSTNVQLSAFTTGTPQFGSSGFISSYPVTFSGTPSTGQVLTATSSTTANWQAVPSVTWADDLAGSTSTNQYVAAISGNAGAGGIIPVNATTLSFGSTQSNPTITQSTISGSAHTLSILGQPNSSGTGGSVNVFGGTGTSNPGAVQIGAASTNFISVAPASGDINIVCGNNVYVGSSTVTLATLAGNGNGYVAVDNSGDLSWSPSNIGQVAEFVQTSQDTNSSIAPGTAAVEYLFDNSSGIVNTIGIITATAAPGPTPQGTAFNLPIGTYLVDFENSNASPCSLAIYQGASNTNGAYTINNNSIAGSTTDTTWIHGRAYITSSGSNTWIIISPVTSTLAIPLAGDSTAYIARITFLRLT